MAKHYWLKLHYKDILSDEKIGLLDAKSFGVYIKLLCQAACSPVQGKLLLTRRRRPTRDELARLLRVDVSTLSEIIDGTLVPLGLISLSQGGVLSFRNWRKYQSGRGLDGKPVVQDSAPGSSKTRIVLNDIDREKEREKNKTETQKREEGSGGVCENEDLEKRGQFDDRGHPL